MELVYGIQGVYFEGNQPYNLFYVYFNKQTYGYILHGRIKGLAVFEMQQFKLVSHVFL